MLAGFLRRYVGSVRLSLTIAALLLGSVVLFCDIFFKLRLSGPIYGYLSSIFGVVAVFIWKDTDRPAGYSTKGIRYSSEKEGEV